MTLSTWLTFLIATTLLCFAPGPGALLSMSAGMKFGWRRGMWSCIGMQVSVMVNVTIIALGLGAILMASNTAFEVLKWCGALYLVWLGIRKFREEPVFSNSALEEIAARTQFKDMSTKGIFMQGFLVSQTNPKGLIFLLAVLPQFVDPTQPVAMQYVILTLTLNVVDLVAMGCYTAFAAKVLMMLKEPEHIRWANRGIGSLFVVAGGALAMFKRG